MKHLILDTETYGLDGPISCAVTYDVGGRGFRLWLAPRDIPALQHELESADWVTGWNLSTFDLPLIYGMAKNYTHPKFDHTTNDLLWRARGANRYQKGWKLGDVGHRTIGKGKNGDGASAPAMATDGDWGALFTYCLGDVILTLELFQFLQRYGYLVGPAGPVRLSAFPTPLESEADQTSHRTSAPRASSSQILS